MIPHTKGAIAEHSPSFRVNFIRGVLIRERGMRIQARNLHNREAKIAEMDTALAHLDVLAQLLGGGAHEHR